MSSKPAKPIRLYVAPTMNGYKIPILLEELGISYTFYHISFKKNEQKQEWYLKINPNGRIPAIVDPNNNDFALAESAAILMYLCEKYDPENRFGLFAKPGSNKYYEIIQWLYFQMSAIGPIMGNAMYFNRIAKPKGYVKNGDFSIQRFDKESKRLLSVIEKQLDQSSGSYICGQYTIADIIHYPWIKSAFWANISLESYPNIQKWLKLIDQRPAVIKGLTVPIVRREIFGEGDQEQIKRAIQANADKFNAQLASKL